jgi:hypothetical protein
VAAATLHHDEPSTSALVAGDLGRLGIVAHVTPCFLDGSGRGGRRLLSLLLLTRWIVLRHGLIWLCGRGAAFLQSPSKFKQLLQLWSIVSLSHGVMGFGGRLVGKVARSVVQVWQKSSCL